MSPTHSIYTPHDDTQGSSYNLILEHVLTNPGTYEIPLRTMYTINSTPCSQMSRPATPTGHRVPTPLMQSTSPTDAQEATLGFQSSLLTQISKQRSQPCSLPPAFLTSFLRRCFPFELELVDFPQALTALDYLKDLERRRRREVASALKRLGISRDSIDSDPDNLHQSNPGVTAWVKANELREHKVEQRYSQLYVSLRRWIMINELSLEPFSRYNCIAMLNTLYPPIPLDEAQNPAQQPSAMLTSEVLSTQRRGFFDWITKVSTHTHECLTPLMKQGARPEDENGWPAVRICLDEYLRLANHVIEECSAVVSPEDLNESGQRRTSAGWYDSTPRSSRKADSGVSFTSKDTSGTSSKRPSTSGSEEQKRRPETPSYNYERTRTGGSTLEKLAREFRRFRTPTPVALESIPPSRRPSVCDRAMHSREASSASSNAGKHEERGGRPRSRSNVFQRSFSRLRARSRSRPRNGNTAGRNDEYEVPPTPSLPPETMSIFEDDEGENDERSGRGRFRRSLNLSRARSGSRGSTALRKMKSLGENKLGRQKGSGEDFDPVAMGIQRQAWEAREAGIGEAI